EGNWFTIETTRGRAACGLVKSAPRGLKVCCCVLLGRAGEDGEQPSAAASPLPRAPWCGHASQLDAGGGGRPPPFDRTAPCRTRCDRRWIPEQALRTHA